MFFFIPILSKNRKLNVETRKKAMNFPVYRTISTKTYFSILGQFHKGDEDEFFDSLCSKECAKKQGLSDEEIKQDESGW